MRAKKFGAPPALRHKLVRKLLWNNKEKNLVLDKVVEFENMKCTGVWFEVSRPEISESTFRFERRKIFATENYSAAWDAVKPEWWSKRNEKRDNIRVWRAK